MPLPTDLRHALDSTNGPGTGAIQARGLAPTQPAESAFPATHAIENNKASGVAVPVSEWSKYLKAGTNLYVTGKDILGNAYGDVNVDSLPSVPAATKAALSDVTDDAFWSPYN